MQISGRSLRVHMTLYSALTLLLTLGLVIVVAWFPLSNRLLSSVELALSHDATMRARAVDETLRRACELAWQVSSRTAARITTAELDRGMISLEEARAALLPRLRDALDFSHEMKGLVRIDLRGRILARIGPDLMDSLTDRQADFPILEAPPVRYASRGHQGMSRIFFLGHDPHVIIFTPVYSPDQRVVAQDLLLFRLDALPPIMAAPMPQGQSVSCLLLGAKGDQAAPEVLLRTGGSKALPGIPALTQSYEHLLNTETLVGRLDELLLCATPLNISNMWLVVGSPQKAMTGEARSWLITILAIVLGLGFLGLLCSLLLLRPLRDKILVAQEELRRQVAETEKARAKLEAQSDLLLERNEDLRHFAYASAHDLKSPLISIGGHAQMLLDRLGPDLPPERRLSLEFILSGTKRLFQHVNDMLEYSRAAEIEPRLTRLSLDRLCQEILSSLDGRIRESRAIIRLGETPDIFSDRRLLRMVLQNLVDNALCYRQPDRAPEVDIQAEAAPHEVVIRVKDNGLGISPDHQPQIFESFYRLHEDAKIPGTGLGLAICLRAVRRLEGTIELESEPGQGSCFTVRLPQPPPEALQEDDEGTPLA